MSVTQHGTLLPDPIVPGAPPSLFDVPPVFDDKTYDPDKDGKRLSGGLKRVYDYLYAHDWVTIEALATATRMSQNGASARIRDLRKAKFGNHDVRPRRVEGGNGLHEYKLFRPGESE